MVVALLGTRSVPAPGWDTFGTKYLLGDSTSLTVGDTDSDLAVVSLDTLLVASIVLGDSLVESKQLALVHPCLLSSIDFRSRSTLRLLRSKSIRKTLDALRQVVGTLDELVITSVNAGRNKLGRLRVGSSDQDIGRTEDVPCESGSCNTVDVFGSGDKHLACLVTALLTTVKLVLEVDTSCTLLGKELGKLEHGAETTVTRVGIGNDRSEVVDPGCLGLLLWRELASLVPVLSVVVLLCLEETLNLIGHSGVRVIGKIGTDLVVASGQNGRACPAET